MHWKLEYSGAVSRNVTSPNATLTADGYPAFPLATFCVVLFACLGVLIVFCNCFCIPRLKRSVWFQQLLHGPQQQARTFPFSAVAFQDDSFVTGVDNGTIQVGDRADVG